MCAVRRMRVSILVVVDWVQRLSLHPKTEAAVKVSILVVVDWVQRQKLRAIQMACKMEFQSLLSWIGFRDTPDLCEIVVSKIVFQSLLSWIGFRDLGARSATRFPNRVSILVVVDWVQRPDRSQAGGFHRLEFQSLLSWIGFRDRNDNPRRDRRISVSILVVVDWVQRLDGFGKCDEAYKVSILVVVDWVQRLSG